MMRQVFTFFKEYYQNSKAVLKSYNNALKKLENIELKDKLEQEFYDKAAERYLNDFKEEVFLYDENEKFPKTHQYFYSRIERISNKQVLDCCCGYGFTSVKCAKMGAKVYGIDISPKMIQLAQKNVNLNNVSHCVDLRLMSVQEMTFNDNSFDFAVGLGALHHLNLGLAGKEISRVLKPGGKAVFLEPRIPFKWLIFVRSLFPNKCYESPGGSQLTDKDIKVFSKYFFSHQVTYFNLINKLARFPVLNKFSGSLETIDRFLIKKIPFLRKFCWAVVVEFVK